MPARPSATSELDPDVDLALAIGLAKSPRDRFRTPDALAGAIEKALIGELGQRVRVRAARLLGDNPWKEI